MSGRPNTAWKQTMLKRFNGDGQALHDHMATIGSRGGAGYDNRFSPPKGFAADPEKARISGSKGGKISRRPKLAV
jgi:general stress protein YciG